MNNLYRVLTLVMLFMLTGCPSTQGPYIRHTAPDDKGGFACIVFLACLF